MPVRLLYVLVIATSVLVGTVGQQLVALAVAGLLVTRRAMIMRTTTLRSADRTVVRTSASPVVHTERRPVHP
jgi:hypothetical protein